MRKPARTDSPLDAQGRPVVGFVIATVIAVAAAIGLIAAVAFAF